MLTNSDVKRLCAREPNFDDMICSLRAVSKQPKKMFKEILAGWRCDPSPGYGSPGAWF